MDDDDLPEYEDNGLGLESYVNYFQSVYIRYMYFID